MMNVLVESEEILDENQFRVSILLSFIYKYFFLFLVVLNLNFGNEIIVKFH